MYNDRIRISLGVKTLASVCYIYNIRSGLDGLPSRWYRWRWVARLPADKHDDATCTTSACRRLAGRQACALLPLPTSPGRPAGVRPPVFDCSSIIAIRADLMPIMFCCRVMVIKWIVFLLHIVVALKRAVLLVKSIWQYSRLALRRAHRGYGGRAGCPWA